MGALCNLYTEQIMELATHYGRLEGMWFDAGWVCAITARISVWAK